MYVPWIIEKSTLPHFSVYKIVKAWLIETGVSLSQSFFLLPNNSMVQLSCFSHKVHKFWCSWQLKQRQLRLQFRLV